MSSETIGRLIENISLKSLVLPEFQREYVWDRSKALALMDSLMKRYPAGSLLLWSTDDPPAIKNDAIEKNARGPVGVILDGQQRLTTLYMLILDQVPPYYLASEIAHNPRSMHFDLETRSFSYPTRRDRESRPTLVPVVDCFAGKVNVFDLPESVLGAGDSTVSKDRLKLFNDNHNDLVTIKSVLYPVQSVPNTAGLNEAIDVFDRVNSSGTRLTDADLALAYISGVWADARRVLKAKQSELKGRGFSFDLQFFARGLAVTTKRRADYSALRFAEADELEQGWGRLSPIMDYLIALLGRVNIHSSKDMATPNTLVPAIAFLTNSGGTFPSDKAVNHFLGWFLLSTIARRYSGGETNQKLSHDVSIAFEDQSPWRRLLDAVEEDRGRLTISPSDLEGLDHKNPVFKVLISLYRHREAVAWFNGVPLSPRRNGSLDLHVHHIYPKGYLKTVGYSSKNVRQRLVINEVANLALLTSPSNLAISSEDPAEYLPDVTANYPNALSSQLVPRTDEFDFNTRGFEDFLDYRRKSVADTLNTYVAALLEGVGTDSAEEHLEDLVRLGQTASIETYDSIFTGNGSDDSVSAGWNELAWTCAAFLNAEGGRILIGVKDGEVVGVEDDLSQLGMASAKTFAELCKQQLRKRLGPEAVSDLSFHTENIGGNVVVVIALQAGGQPTFVQLPDYREFPVRDGLEVKALSGEDEIQDYIAGRWKL